MNDQAPWKENTYFATPKISVVAFSGDGKWHPILTADINRVGVLFSVGGTGSVYLSTDLTATTLPGSGILIAEGTLPLRFLQKEWGPLPSLDWWGLSSTTTVLTVVESLLREWPRAQPWIVLNPPGGT